MERSKSRWWDAQRSRTTDDRPRTSYALIREGSAEMDSPSTSTAPTPEPRLPQQSSNGSIGDSWMNTTEAVISSQSQREPSPSFSNGTGISKLRLNSRPSSSFPPHQFRPTLLPTSSSASQSDDDDDGDETDHQDFADKSFQLSSSRPTDRRGSLTKLRTQSAGVIPDEALDWLNQTSALSGSGKGKESAEGVGARLSRRHTITHEVGSADGSSSGEQEVVEPVVEGLASTIPQEIILHIFRNLTCMSDIRAALLVCRSWCICAVTSIWSKPSCQSRESLTELIRVIRTCGPQPINGVQTHRSRQVATFPYASIIRRLNFVSLHGSLTNEQLAEFALCSRLERLTLAGNRSLDPKTLVKVVSCMPELVAVDLSGVVKTTDEVVETIAKTSGRLQGLNLSGCTAITDKGVVALAERSTLLRRIKLMGCSEVTDEGIIALATLCPLILEYDLQGLDNVTDVSMRQIWLNSAHVRELRLNGNDLLTDEGFPCLKAMPVLPTPDEERDFSRFRGRSHTAKSSDSEGSSTESGMSGTSRKDSRSSLSRQLILRTTPVTRKFDYLRTVDLTGCTQVTDETIEAIVSNATKIRMLTLAKCGLLTDAALESICRLGKHLHLLHLGHVNQITDVAVTKLVRSCTRMRYIDLASCPLLTDMSVFEIAANLPKLRRVGLVKVVNITDQAIYALVERGERTGPNLMERVHLSYCDKLSVKAITHLLRKIPHITHLSLTGVTAFRQPEYQRFCRPAPKEFNSHQRAAFCVFSGKSVADLRSYLIAKEAAQAHAHNTQHLPQQWHEDSARAFDNRESPHSASSRYLAQSPHLDIPAPYEHYRHRSPLSALVSANHVTPSFFPAQMATDYRYAYSHPPGHLQVPMSTPVDEGRNAIEILDQLLDRVRADEAEGEGSQRRRSRRDQ